MALRAAWRKIFKYLSKHSIKLLTAANAIGTVVTTGLAIEAGYKTSNDIRDLKVQYPNGVPKKELVKNIAPNFIPTALSLTATTAAGIGSASIASKRNAALASLYSASELALKEYKNEVREAIGEKKEIAIEDKIAENKIKSNPPVESTIVATGYGDQLCYDSWTDRYFTCSIEHIRKVQNEMNKRILSEMHVTFNEVYEELGLRPVHFGETLVWNVDHMIDFHFSSCIDDYGRPCIVVDHYNRPVTLGNEQI